MTRKMQRQRPSVCVENTERVREDPEREERVRDDPGREERESQDPGREGELVLLGRLHLMLGELKGLDRGLQKHIYHVTRYKDLHKSLTLTFRAF